MVKSAVVTGASSGIGYALTVELAKHGYEVYACARRLTDLEKLAEKHSDLKIHPYKLDITQPNEVKKFGDYLQSVLITNAESEPKLDLLYNNAGQSCTFPALDVTNDVLEQCFKVNVFGHINMCRELSKYVINAKGTIVFTGSIAGIVTFPFGSIYSSTKAAIHSYARGLHLEMEPFGVRVINAITGGVATDIADTRPLPESSIFNFKEGKEAFACRQKMAANNKPVSAEIYAAQIVEIIQSSRDPVDVYRGTMSSVMYWVSILVPFWLLEFVLAKKFKLDKAFAILKEKGVKKV
ncbi:acylglycerone-phosphate reductase KNAG_0E01800 [Huiozyma naganishii CBS 8797]|uniref:Uncharacterized protein n=1 Tax=Huiozyma naganishii (strain ATCC MYA-139 / BCRC 22969 / CBS 8797 / KCTC 17520 / NBRC 10181 / NCYC 3082 / Yp74L-3) TaxID=1071383 RepID=J7RZ21_HUIN7|nr:hypothetical protein KNAG_0E01800 [Kazachstania naganishii CBS 8797]CCK70442.1 hypothetical protein KNAG_0E01800 [Kazachstania naganishii CBS 8797]